MDNTIYGPITSLAQATGGRFALGVEYLETQIFKQVSLNYVFGALNHEMVVQRILLCRVIT